MERFEIVNGTGRHVAMVPFSNASNPTSKRYWRLT
jgi:hypothetical protein